MAERSLQDLKMEPAWQQTDANQAEAKVDVMAHSDGFYDITRLHSVLSNLPPAVFKSKRAEKNLSSCSKLLDHCSAPLW